MSKRLFHHGDAPTRVVGRLAPSPTGALHLGNLSTSALAWAQARASQGTVVLRIEDLDPPRVVAGAAEQLVDDLRWLGLDWDAGPDIGGPDAPYVQSARGERYAAAAERLTRDGLLYPCTCSRADIRDALSAPHTSFDPQTLYPGTCARRVVSANAPADGTYALRFRAHGVVDVQDELAGRCSQDLSVVPGDFVVRRRDGLWAYQLAVVVDDIAMGVTDIVRGRDLLDSTPRQFALFDAFAAPRPRTWHAPLLLDERGDRLAKRDGSMAREGLEAVGWSSALLRGGLLTLWGWRDRLEPARADELAAAFTTDGLARASLRVADAFFRGPDAWARHLDSEKDHD